MVSRFVTSAFLTLLLVASPWPLLSDQPSYHAEITAARHRYLELEHQKTMGSGLSLADEKERLCLLGQLIDQDPVMALTREIVADALTLQQGPGKPEERAAAERLFQLSAITTQFEARATTLPEAKSFASVLREFVVRRDVEGARAWANAQ